ncbi:DNA methyltransferase [Streptomyces sp. WAC 06783]|uniref:HsdM family class I SAM-dependent methyltransferase n=1 Tax=Streptomyces sp. WAC 06783 TaxID=2203211 RepID=UPI000F7373DC|nr:class I SAM-dependent DNA methyltransferase [Streptomyces sp. WAC 06783]RSO10370.1 DNA methyltransferase [Streptomyces sp. WAC 06783]
MTDMLPFSHHFSRPVAVSNGKAARVSETLMDYCTVLCDRGLSTMEAVEQLTYLLILKLEDELLSLQPSRVEESWPTIPEQYRWASLVQRQGDDLVACFDEILAHRSHHGAGTMLGGIFTGAQNHVHDAKLLRRLVRDLFQATTWSVHGADVLGGAYDALLEGAMNDVKNNAGQYFTPRPLIEAVVEVMQPNLTDTVADPACGTGGFLIGVHKYLLRNQSARKSPTERNHYRTGQVRGDELVPRTARLATANLLLHDVASAGQIALISVCDALAQPPCRRASLVLAHPPFGRHAAMPIGPSSTSRHDTPERADFVTGSIDKQVNFLQHVMSSTAEGGRAAVVVPDNVLFATGAVEIVRRNLVDQFDVHTVLRLPVGAFDSVRVAANVVFFDRPPRRPDAHPRTTKVWVYDLRSGRRRAPGHASLSRSDLNDFVSVYLPGRPRTERVETELFRCFDVQDVLGRYQARLDLSYPSEAPGTARLAPPEEIALDVARDLRLALREFDKLVAELSGDVS